MNFQQLRNGINLRGYRLAVSAILVFFVSICSFPFLLGAEEKVKGRLIVEDVLARPGTSVMLKARLVQDGLLGVTGLGGESIEFVVQGQRAGIALTGGDGRAFLEFKSSMRGNQKIMAKLEPNPRVNAITGVGNFASWERRKPILLVDVMTLVKSEEGDKVSIPLLSLLGVENFGEPDENAPTELGKLGEFYYNIIYLLRGANKNVEGLREWLKTSKFPPGISRSIQPGPAELLAFLEKLKKGGWDHIEAGIGQTKGFADTLVKNRIKVVIFPDPNKKEKFPRRAKIVSTWKEVRKHL